MKSTTPQTDALRCSQPDFEKVFALAELLETQAEYWEQRARTNAVTHNEVEDERFRLQLALKRCRNVLSRLNSKVHSGYDFNADPDGITLIVGEELNRND